MRTETSSFRNTVFTFCIFGRIQDGQPIPVGVRSKAWVCGRSIAGNAGSIRIPLRACIFVCSVCCVGKGLCDEVITRSEESYWACVCVCNCVWSRNLNNEAAWARVELLRHRKKKQNIKASKFWFASNLLQHCNQFYNSTDHFLTTGLLFHRTFPKVIILVLYKTTLWTCVKYASLPTELQTSYIWRHTITKPASFVRFYILDITNTASRQNVWGL